MRLLVLDVGGVLLTDALPAVLAEAADAAGINVAMAADAHASGAGQRLWRGEISEDGYWDVITRVIGGDDRNHWRRRLADGLMPLVPARRLASWASRLPVWLLTVHRHEWLVPRLAQVGFASSIERQFISSLCGVVKPEVAAFEQVLAAAPCARNEILFVDDRRANLRAARALGMRVLEADGARRWQDQVEGILDRSWAMETTL